MQLSTIGPATSSLWSRALSHPLYLPPTARPPLSDDPAVAVTLAALTYVHFLALSYLALSPVPYSRFNRLTRLILLPSTLASLSKLFMAHRAGDLELWNESGWGAFFVYASARAVILSLGLFGQAQRLRWIGWTWYTRREEGWWGSLAGKEELKRFDYEVLRGAVAAREKPGYPCRSALKRLGLAALFLLSPRHLGFSTGRPPSFYTLPRRPLLYHFCSFLLAGAICDLTVLLYSRHIAFSTFQPDPSLRPSIFNPLPSPYPNLLTPIRVALLTLNVGATIKSSVSMVHHVTALLCSALLPTHLSSAFPFPSLNLLSPFALLLPPSLSARFALKAPESVRTFWNKAWHDFLSIDIAHLAFFPLLTLTRCRLLAVLSAFTFSGLIHGVSLEAVGLGRNYSGMMAVFLSQAVGVVLEHVWERQTGKRVSGAWGRLWTVAVVGSGGVLLTELFVSRGYLGFRRPFSPVGHALKGLGYWPDRLQQPGPLWENWRETAYS
ncbi:hypothetical protein JCM11641_007586 [Rhodosporidiobolus odoratus]